MTSHPKTGIRPLPIGTVTFLFTDIEGSTRLVQELGADWVDALEKHNAILESAVAGNGGIVVKTDGDAVFAVFPEARDSVLAARDAQLGLARADWGPGARVHVRMGIHTGSGVLGGADYVGIDVHRAARIAAAAHGDQVVASEATVILVERELPDGTTLRDLGKHRLKDLSEPEAIFQLCFEGLPIQFDLLRTLDAIPNNLPAQVTSFVGRERELAEGLRLLGRARILTLTGPGGTGKTRLSLQIAAEASDGHPDGVFFVGLSSIAEADLVASQILEILGLSASGSQTPEDKLLEQIGSKSVLLLLDNFEQLLDAAPLVGAIARTSPRTKVIVTSRAPLRVAGEQEMPVPPLSTTGDGTGDASLSDGVRLLVERAMAVRPDFLLDESNQAAVVELVNRLDGLPLAIELVASRLRLLPIADILGRLDSHMLGAGSVDLPERQRTIAKAIDWSYDLLTEASKDLFARLSVFAGGARLEEIEALAGTWSAEPSQLLDGLATLVDNSLLQSLTTREGPRFRMLHVIREYAAKRLEEGGDAGKVRRAHLETYAALTERLAPELLKLDRARWFDVLEADHDNIRAALDHGRATGETNLVLRLAAAAWRFWQARGHLYEGNKRLDDALAMPGGEPRNRAKAIEALGGIYWWRGDLARCHELYTEALAMQEEIGDEREIANALYNHGLTLGFVTEDYEAGRRQLERAKAIYLRLGDENGLGDVAWGIGTSYAQETDFVDGEGYYVEATEHYRRAGNLFGVGWSAFEVAGHRYRMERYVEAWPYLRESLALFADHRDVSGVVLTVSQAAGIALGVGESQAAYRMAGGYNRLRVESGTDLVSSSLNVVQGLEPETLEHLSGDAMAAYLEGQALTFEQLVAYVLAWQPPNADG